MASIQSSNSLTETQPPHAAAQLAEAEAASSSEEKAAAPPQQKGFGLNQAIDAVLNLLSAVPFGLVLLVSLITACMIGMLIQQQDLETFGKYYNELTPAEKVVYGRLGFFDIYHVWYFNLLLLLLSLNIILASIDHFPKAWSFFKKKKLTASPLFAKTQRTRTEVTLLNLQRATLTERAAAAARKLGFKVKVTAEEERTTVFAERGLWNRLGAYAVHVSLLTIFAGGFLTSRGYTGSMEVRPGQSSDKMIKNVYNVEHATTQYAIGTQELQLPYTIEGVDIQQTLINKERGIDAGNTLDWLTRVKITDHQTGRQTEALVHMNKPFDYRGYRFFQASFNPLGSARSMKVRVTPSAGGQAEEVTLARNGETKLSDGTRLRFIEFVPAFTVNREGRPDISSTEYENPAVHLGVIKPNGETSDIWAFTEAGRLALEGAPFLKDKFLNTGDRQFVLADFEKVPSAHILSIQYDPGSTVVYIGFGMLCLLLILIFFFSHQRLWIVVEDGKAYLGGDANRNRLGFEDRVNKVAALIQEPQAAGGK